MRGKLKALVILPLLIVQYPALQEKRRFSEDPRRAERVSFLPAPREVLCSD
jgi:hypothetical protein